VIIFFGADKILRRKYRINESKKQQTGFFVKFGNRSPNEIAPISDYCHKTIPEAGGVKGMKE